MMTSAKGAQSVRNNLRLRPSAVNVIHGKCKRRGKLYTLDMWMQKPHEDDPETSTRDSTDNPFSKQESSRGKEIVGNGFDEVK